MLPEFQASLAQVKRESTRNAPRVAVLRGETREFVKETGTLRAVVQGAREGRPGYASLLREQYGYDLETLPAEGTLFVDPYFVDPKARAGLVNATTFPSPAAPAAPQDVDRLLFGQGSGLSIPGAAPEDEPVRFSSPLEYRAYVAENRIVKLGLRGDSGDAVPVHLSFSGGGGKGKRYVAAYAELSRLGIVPASVAGTSAGAIAASLVAAGADPATLERVLKDERFSQLLDTLGPGAIAKGKVAYQLFEDVLGELTGIKDRPVTFADLRLPLTVLATKYTDSGIPRGSHEGLDSREDRTFVFSREATPNTPVALALRASMAIPAVFAPVEMVDPLTGRTVTLVDGGLLENMPLNRGSRDLPEVALHPVARGYSTNNRLSFRMPRIPFPCCQLFAHTLIQGAVFGFEMFMGSRQAHREYDQMTAPPEGTFVVNLPVWDTGSPSKADSLLSFKYEPEIDPGLDQQTTRVIDDFFRKHLPSLGQAGVAASNVGPSSGSLSFARTFEHEDKTWTATYEGGRSIALRSEDGAERFILARKRDIENWLVEDASFGDLSAKLQEAMEKRFGGTEALLEGLPENWD